MTRGIRDIVPVQERRMGPGRRRPPKREVISWLRQALENGLVQSDTVQNSKEFEALREHRDFCELVAEYSI